MSCAAGLFWRADRIGALWRLEVLSFIMLKRNLYSNCYLGEFLVGDVI